MKNKKFLMNVKVATTDKEGESKFTQNDINMDGEYTYFILV